MMQCFLSSNCVIIFLDSHFILELSSESFEVLHSYIGSNDHPLLQQLLNTTLEVNIIKSKIDTSSANQANPKTIVSHFQLQTIENHNV